MITIVVSPSGGTCCLAIIGDLDMLTTPGLIDAALASGSARELVIDLSGVGFIDATGLGGLATVRAVLGRTGRRLHIVGASPRITRTFTLARAQFLLTRQQPDMSILDQLTAAVIGAVRAAPRPVRLSACRPEAALTP